MISDNQNINSISQMCMEAHRRAFECWTEGNIVDYWEDEQGNICVRYESGNWWHYSIRNGKVTGWW